MNLWWSETAGQNFLRGGEIISPVGEGFIPSASGENPFAHHPTPPPLPKKCKNFLNPPLM